MSTTTKARKAPTAEQKAAAAAKRERFRGIAQQLAKMTDDQRAALVGSVGAIVNCESRALSTVNSCLLIMQRPSVSMVGGFWQWQNVGRRVMKGETGLSLWIPTMKGSSAEPADLSYGGEPIGTKADAEAEPSNRFVIGTVFDITQTEPMA